MILLIELWDTSASLMRSREQCSYWETSWSSTNQEMPHLVLNPRIYYHVQKSPPLSPNLCLTNPVYTHTPAFFKIRFNILLSSAPSSPKWCLCLLVTTIFYPFPIFTMRAACPTRLTLLDLNTMMIFGEDYKYEVPHPHPCNSALLLIL
jgi:hypothetical protein